MKKAFLTSFGFKCLCLCDVMRMVVDFSFLSIHLKEMCSCIIFHTEMSSPSLFEIKFLITMYSSEYHNKHSSLLKYFNTSSKIVMFEFSPFDCALKDLIVIVTSVYYTV